MVYLKQKDYSNPEKELCSGTEIMGEKGKTIFPEEAGSQ